ncbi:MAG: hypothetical protein ABI759_02925 [Candidatus Solibacter sp.]
MEKIHEGRADYAAQFDYDLDRMFEDLKRKEAENTAPRSALSAVARKPSSPA